MSNPWFARDSHLPDSRSSRRPNALDVLAYHRMLSTFHPGFADRGEGEAGLVPNAAENPIEMAWIIS